MDLRDKLNVLLNIHNEFVAAASHLPEGLRPYAIQGRLEEIQKQIMETQKEIFNQEPITKSTKPSTSDDIPF